MYTINIMQYDRNEFEKYCNMESYDDAASVAKWLVEKSIKPQLTLTQVVTQFGLMVAYMWIDGGVKAV